MTKTTAIVLAALLLDVLFVGYIFSRLFAGETPVSISAERIFR